MNYEDEILSMLNEVGDVGMPLRRIALNVFNMKNSFFEPLSQEAVYQDVAEWLRDVSQQSGAPVIRAERRGWYRINPDSPRVKQMELEFQPHF
jgi:hypothetical protein